MDTLLQLIHIDCMSERRSERYSRSMGLRGRARADVIITTAVLAAIGLLFASLMVQTIRVRRQTAAVAEQAMRQYATVAAWQFGREARAAIRSRIGITLVARVAHLRTLQASAPDPARVAAAMGDAPECDCPLPPRPTAVFVIAAGSDAPAFGGEPVLPAIAADIGQRELGHSVRVVNGAGGEHEGFFSGNVLVMWTTWRERGGRVAAIVGAIVPKETLQPAFDSIRARVALLPTALLRKASQDSLIAIRLLSASSVVYASGGPHAGFGGTDTTSLAPHGARIEATVAPPAASRLIIGGIPAMQAPLLALLAVGASVLLAVAVLQFRRTSELARTRSDFIASTSHELRTPLTLIGASAQTLMMENAITQPDQRRLLDIIGRESIRLSGIVENVLRSSESDRGRAVLHLEVEDLGALVERIAADFAPLCESKSCRLRTGIAEGVRVRCDRAAVRQILFNILENALRHGPERQTISIDVQRTPFMQIVVEDEGPGIPASERQRVFDRYTRLHDVADGAPPGAGIGLSVVRELAEAQGWSVWIEEAPTGGARVVVRTEATVAS